MKIYTKSGDSGMTGLYGGKRVSKNSPRITAYGEIDELNGILGMTIAETPHGPIKDPLTEIQSHLFTLGTQLASPNADAKIEIVTAAHSQSLERQIDLMEEQLDPLKNFILPGGSKTSALLHFARTVCRRAERSCVYLNSLEDEEVDKWVLIFLNRLSDYLFVLARFANHIENIKDKPWLPQKKG